MALSADEVRHVAMLARLAIDDEQVEHLASELSAILEYAEQVGEVAAADVEPMTHPFPLDNVLRPDEPGEILDRDELLSQAPEREDDRFVVPQIVSADEGGPG
ncbi:MAG: Asp-tRNA(Asn)/Glu-tRNA(Gln) amidotransferase subunit GatC [Nitriliruptorales bacterium]|nr:Asp-tRNA(Asn)/Glu-tRNA(Gln) amidotransferase subunit GatC [Nitriliruptorales bacterium]